MYGVENQFKLQLLLGLKGSPLVGGKTTNFVPPCDEADGAGEQEEAVAHDEHVAQVHQ